MRGPIAVGVFGVLTAALLGAPGAHAQSRDACVRIQAQLANLDRSASPSGSFSDAARRQRAELERAEGAFARCGLGPSTAVCVQLAEAIPRMRANLARLDGAARREGGGGGSNAERERLRRAFVREGCDRPPAPPREAVARPATAPPPPQQRATREPPPVRAPAPAPVTQPARPDPAPGGFLGLFTRPDQRNIFERFEEPRPPAPDRQQASLLRGGFATPQEAAEAERRRAETERRRERDRHRRAENFTPRSEAPRNTFRTLCVRSCDGYYWPISFATNRAGFARDADICRASCPNAEVTLYVHRNPGEWSEAAVSLDGRPYTELATAFRYRSEFDAACQCRPAMSAAIIDFQTDRMARADAAPPQFALQNLRPAIVPVLSEPEPQWEPPPFDPDALPVVITFDAAVTSDRRVGPEGLRGVNADPRP
jgi:hypothetical protein